MSNAHIFNKENSLTYNFQRFNYLGSLKRIKIETKELFIKRPTELFANVLTVFIV